MKIALNEVMLMFGITFGVAMFVALIIQTIYKSITSRAFSRLKNKSEQEKYSRAKRIYKIHSKKIANDIPLSEPIVDIDIINYYYGGRGVLKNS